MQVDVDARFKWRPSKLQVVFVVTSIWMPGLGESLL